MLCSIANKKYHTDQNEARKNQFNDFLLLHIDGDNSYDTQRNNGCQIEGIAKLSKGCHKQTHGEEKGNDNTFFFS